MADKLVTLTLECTEEQARELFLAREVSLGDYNRMQLHTLRVAGCRITKPQPKEPKTMQPDAILPHALYVLVVDLENAARRGTCAEVAAASAAVKAWTDAENWTW